MHLYLIHCHSICLYVWRTSKAFRDRILGVEIELSSRKQIYIFYLLCLLKISLHINNAIFFALHCTLVEVLQRWASLDHNPPVSLYAPGNPFRMHPSPNCSFSCLIDSQSSAVCNNSTCLGPPLPLTDPPWLPPLLGLFANCLAHFNCCTFCCQATK